MACAAALAGLAVSAPAQPAPAAEAAPLPDVAVLLADVLERQNEIEAAREAYTYTKVATDLEEDGRGGVVEKTLRTYEVFSVSGRRFEKLVARGGRPLPPHEARDEEERVAKSVRQHRKKVAERDASRRRSTEGGDDITVSDLLRVCRFVNARREAFRGRQAIVYDFEARPDARARGRVESWIRKMVGTVWIDEDARRILRLEARLNEGLKAAAGLALSVRRGSSLVFEQALVNGEVWLPSYAEVRISARLLLLKSIRVHQAQRFFDYRKFSVDTSTEIRTPGP